jgi:hypothetical protein
MDANSDPEQFLSKPTGKFGNRTFAAAHSFSDGKLSPGSLRPDRGHRPRLQQNLPLPEIFPAEICLLPEIRAHSRDSWAMA